jgi:hypothetical protein
LLNCFMKVYKGKYSQVHLMASLTAGLSRYHDGFAVAVVDEVLEEIRVGLEMNDYGMQQRRIAYMRFLGELYSYRLIDSPVIFDTLYLIIFFGYGTAEVRPSLNSERCDGVLIYGMIINPVGLLQSAYVVALLNDHIWML